MKKISVLSMILFFAAPLMASAVPVCSVVTSDCTRGNGCTYAVTLDGEPLIYSASMSLAVQTGKDLEAEYQCVYIGPQKKIKSIEDANGNPDEPIN